MITLHVFITHFSCLSYSLWLDSTCTPRKKNTHKQHCSYNDQDQKYNQISPHMFNHVQKVQTLRSLQVLVTNSFTSLWFACFRVAHEMSWCQKSSSMSTVGLHLLSSPSVWSLSLHQSVRTAVPWPQNCISHDKLRSPVFRTKVW